MDFLSFVGTISVFIVIYLFLAVKIVSQAELVVIERLGKFHRTLGAGINFIVPFIDQKRSSFSTQEQIIDVPRQAVITKDNVSIQIDAVVFIRINDAKQATYEIQDLKGAIAQLAQTTLRAEIGRMELDDTLSSRADLNAVLLTALDLASSTWGAKVTRVEVADISVPEAVQSAMELQMEAERRRRATETEAEGDKNALVFQAEGERQQAFKQAEAVERMADAHKYEKEQLAMGEQKAMELINQAMLENKDAASFLLAKDRIAAFAGLASSDSANKVIVPVETSEMVGSLAAFTSILGQNASTK
ncbi:SPFH domain-containing protein [Thiomicrorhabdus lithotrophica]|uniref:SPFH/Band 7/PHB domain protein n=1 Tax=Thiomicrorhabdus lithotrophica TaxID=2949997 RepID=A0ABY8CA42_9GAMM|nr:SPFH domain-containing protein [Thiomicrorhabdus lithotrophica]WEJ62844.1 SPFH/Band 7/PHB domain protein [Thiomicrorhabdus lithotrophica]